MLASAHCPHVRLFPFSLQAVLGVRSCSLSTGDTLFLLSSTSDFGVGYFSLSTRETISLITIRKFSGVSQCPLSTGETLSLIPSVSICILLVAFDCRWYPLPTLLLPGSWCWLLLSLHMLDSLSYPSQSNVCLICAHVSISKTYGKVFWRRFICRKVGKCNTAE